MRRPTLCCAIADTGKRCRAKAVVDARVMVDRMLLEATTLERRTNFVQVPLCSRHTDLRSES